MGLNSSAVPNKPLAGFVSSAIRAERTDSDLGSGLPNVLQGTATVQHSRAGPEGEVG
jgi:hypothetical protein